MTLAAMSVRLKQTDPNIHRAVLLEGTRYAEEKLQNREPDFKITIPKSPPTFERFVARASVQVVFRVISRRLKSRWENTPSFARLRGHYVNRTGRYTERQHQGNLRWQETVSYRTEAVMRIASIFERGAARFISPTGTQPILSESEARQWVIKLKTPNHIAYAILAFYQSMTPRQLKELMREAKNNL